MMLHSIQSASTEHPLLLPLCVDRLRAIPRWNWYQPATLNATTRLHVKRLSRLTLAFSKKLENFQAAVGLHFAYYNVVRRHNTLRCTPAMAAGVERNFWTVGDLVEATS